MSIENCKILYVDDHQDSSDILKMLLSPIEVQTASTIEEAFALAMTQDFDLYVIDRRLPDGSGQDLLKRLSDLRPGVPCIIYSGDVYAVHRREAEAANVAAYVPKPFIEELIQTVEKILSERECAMA